MGHGVRAIHERDFPEMIHGVLPFGLAAARQHAHFWASLTEAGRVIGPHDMLIAATALARGDALGTLNVGEFGRVPGLRLVPLDGFA